MSRVRLQRPIVRPWAERKGCGLGRAGCRERRARSAVPIRGLARRRIATALAPVLDDRCAAGASRLPPVDRDVNPRRRACDGGCAVLGDEALRELLRPAWNARVSRVGGPSVESAGIAVELAALGSTEALTCCGVRRAIIHVPRQPAHGDHRARAHRDPDMLCPCERGCRMRTSCHRLPSSWRWGAFRTRRFTSRRGALARPSCATGR